MNNKITITMPYYDAPEMLRKQVEYWHTYPAWVRESLSIILVDDGSQKYPALDVLNEINIPDLVSFSLYRIKEDIPWNHGGARNLAFTHADSGWCVLTDIDHVLPMESICSLMTAPLQEYCAYKPARFRVKGLLDWDEINRHGDSFILTREVYWKVGGFDEDFSGYWNGVSGPFRKALRRKAEIRELDCVHFLLFCNDMIPDASVTSLGRKGSEYDIFGVAVDRKQYNKTHRNGHYKPTNPLRFSWTQVI